MIAPDSPGPSAKPPGGLRGRVRQAYWDALAVLGELRAPRVRLPSAQDTLQCLRVAGGSLAAAGHHADKGELSQAMHLVRRHFAGRKSPHFFVGPAEVPALAAEMARKHPTWPGKALITARDALDALGQGGAQSKLPNWNRLARAPGNDTLAWHRPHQLAWLTQLARARAFGHDTAGRMCDGLRSWMRSVDRSRRSPAYGDALIAVHRGASLTWALHFLLADEGVDDQLPFQILSVLLSDIRFVYSRLGQSYPNNHLLADGFFCWYMGVLFPEFAEAAAWRRDGEALWLTELRRQVLPDGASFEHSVHYHELVCEMLTAYLLLSRRNGLAVPDWVEARAQGMLRFQSALGGPEAVTAQIGDSVEDSLFSLDDCADVGSGCHREILRSLFDASEQPLSDADRGAQRAMWLLGAASLPSREVAAASAFSAFVDGGVFVLRRGPGTDRAVFRTGPGKDAPLAPGHMHADLLSLGLHVQGVPVLVDPGTYSYRSRADAWPRGEPPWRRHFMSPQAHNGPCLGDLDMLDRGEGDFPAGSPKSWVRHDLTLFAAELACVAATIEGKTAYAGHRRVLLQVGTEYWVVIDRFPANGTEPAYLNFQLAGDARLRSAGDAVFETIVSEACVGWATGNLSPPVVYCGSVSPLAGWLAPAYGVLRPAPSLRLSPKDRSMPTAMALCPAPLRARSVSCSPVGGGDLELVVDFGQYRDVLLIGTSSRDGAGLDAHGVHLRGTLAWLRERDGEPMRAVVAGERDCGMKVGDDLTRAQRQGDGQAGALLVWNAAD